MININSIWAKIQRKFLFTFARFLPDRFYLEKLFPLIVGYPLDLDNPQTFNEKLQWLKLYDRNPEYTKMVDKYEVKSIVASLIGSQYVIPLYGVWDDFDDIDFDKLPNQFVLKCTHDSGGFVVCRNKSNFDKITAKKILSKCLSENYYWLKREWAYKNVKPRIIAEKYMPSLGNIDSVEYKLTVINGKVKVITVCSGIPHSDFKLRHNDNFDVQWNRQDWYAYYEPVGGVIGKPSQMDRIVELSEELAKNVPTARIDWYIIDGHIFFGEMTFYTWAGFIEFTPKEWDINMGRWLTLPEVRKK